MKRVLLIFGILTTINVLPCRAQNEIALNDSISVQMRDITRGEYVARMEATKHLRKPLMVITDIDEVKRMLGDRVRVFESGDYKSIENLIFDNGTTKMLDGDYVFEAYFPELNIMTFTVGHMLSRYFNMNNGDFGYGWPQTYSASPDKKWLINECYPGQGDGWVFLLYNQYRYVGILFHGRQIMNDISWSWTDNNVVLIKETGWDDKKERCSEMTIITK